MSRTLPMPNWDLEDSRPRVLIEATNFAGKAALAGFLHEHGCSVRTCGGPEATDDRCALVECDRCDGVAKADVVVHAMGRHDPRNREVIATIVARFPDTPVVVEAPIPLVERHPDDYAECVVVPQPATSASLLEAVESVLG